MKERKALGHPPKYEKPTQNRWVFDCAIFGPLGLAVSARVSVLAMFLIGVTAALLDFYNVCSILPIV